MDGSISVNIAPEQNDNPAVPFTIHATGPEGYNQSHIVWTAAELPYVHTFDNITNEGSYEIVVTNAYGCDINLSIPIVDCEGIFPYIKNLRVMATPASGNPITVYNGNWLQQGDCIAFQGGSIPVQLDNPSTTGLRILFSASEVLDDNTVTISLPGLSSSMVQVNSINTYTYEATFPLLTAADIQGEQQIIIEGATIDGKQLLDLRNMSNDLEDCVQLPQFTDDCSIPTLLEPGADDVHVFEITCMMVDAEITYPSNPDANDGAIELTLGGVPPYSIYWTLGSGTSDPTPYPTSPNAQSIFELKSGEYCVYIKDGNGCRYTNCWSLKPCSPKKLDFKFETICPNDETGEVCGFIYDAFLNIPSDVLYDFQWTWNAGEYFEGSVSQSCPPYEFPLEGEICVEAKDLSGCGQDLMKCFTFPNNYTPVFLVNSFVNDACGSIPSGSISLMVGGGKAPFTYQWVNAAGQAIAGNSATVSGLSAGTYSVTITDACEGVFAGSFGVGLLETELVLNPIVTGSCSGGNNGSIVLEIIDGTEPLSFQWSNNDATQNISGLGAGIYSVTVTDGCENEFPYSLSIETSPNTVFSTNIVQPVNQLPGCEGAITVVPNSNVAGPFTYNWSNGSIGASINDLCPDTYIVVIMDNNGCEYELEIELEAECVKLPDISAATFDAENCNDGQIKINSIVGFGPLEVVWENGLEPNSAGYINDLLAGDYSVTITDAVGCVAVETFTVNGNASGFPNAFIIDETILYACEGLSNGSAEIFVTLADEYSRLYLQ